LNFHFGTPIMRGFVFVLLISMLSCPAGWSHEPDLIDDQAFQRSATHSLRQWLADPDRVPAAHLHEQLASRTHHVFDLPPSQPAGPLGPAEIYSARRDSVVGLAYLFKCPRCDDWHASIAGGVMLTADGIGVTNHHVMAQNKEESKAVFGVVTFPGAFYPIVEILAASQADDLAIFRVQGSGFATAPLSAGDFPGEAVTAITHPSGNFYTVTTGIVARNFRERGGGAAAGRPRMAITADFAKGSSGAGIFNARGELASIATSTRSIYYSRQDGIDRNLQMVLKTTIPAAAILRLIRDQAAEPAVAVEHVSKDEVAPCPQSTQPYPR
jgi:serine protease Do